MAFAEPRNKPTPTVPPMAISWMWRLRRLRASEVGCCDMRGFRVYATRMVGTSGRWPEQRVAPPLREFVALHEHGRAVCDQRRGDTIVISRSAAQEAPEPQRDIPRRVAGKEHQDARRGSLVSEPVGHELLLTALSSRRGCAARRCRAACTSSVRGGQDRERRLEPEV